MAKIYVKNTDGTYTPQSSVLVSNLDIVQDKGNSLISAMSQKAVTDELKGKQDTIIDIETIRSNAQNASDIVTNMTNAGYLFAGIATPTTNPGTPDAKVFYIANGKGTYEKFGGLEVTEDDVVVLYWDTAWHKVPTGIASQAKLSELESEIGNTLGKNYKFYDVLSYQNLLDNALLKKGSRIVNNGIPIIVANNNSMEGRIDIYSGTSVILDSDKYFVRSFNVAGNVDFEYYPVGTIDGIQIKNNSIDGDKIKNNSIDGDKIKNNSINGDKILDNAITIEKTDFFESVNLVNPNDADVAIDKFLVSSGNLSTNTGYNTTGFIPVKEGMTYYIGSKDKGVNYARMLAFYDITKGTPIQYLQNVSESVVAPANAAYIRLTISKDSWNDAQLTEGAMKNYSPFQIVMKSEYLPKSRNEQNLFFFLPKHIYVAAGRTIELYYEQILLGAEKYNIKATCPIGKALERKYQIVGDSSKVGNYTLSIDVYDDSSNHVAGGSTTIHIVSSEISKEIKVLPIGDSLTNDKPWLTELHTLSANISTIGTRKGIHEGRSGANISNYTDTSGAAIYNFDNYYSGTGSDAEIFSESKSYSIGDIVRKSTIAGNGQAGYDTFVFTSNHDAGAWNDSEVYCINKGNPFYDFNNKKFSMNFYKSFQNIDYNTILIYLGTNGINLTPETNPKGALGMKDLINLIRQEDTTSPIIVVNTIYRSGQNGIGNQGNTDGYTAQSSYKFEEDKKVLLLAKSLEEMVGDMPNVYICPVGFTHDSRYNFGNVKVSVNPRLTDTTEVYELQPLDSVHPQQCGYLQMADEMFSTICSL